MHIIISSYIISLVLWKCEIGIKKYNMVFSVRVTNILFRSYSPCLENCKVKVKGSKVKGHKVHFQGKWWSRVYVSRLLTSGTQAHACMMHIHANNFRLNEIFVRYPIQMIQTIQSYSLFSLVRLSKKKWNWCYLYQIPPPPRGGGVLSTLLHISTHRWAMDV